MKKLKKFLLIFSAIFAIGGVTGCSKDYSKEISEKAEEYISKYNCFKVTDTYEGSDNDVYPQYFFYENGETYNTHVTCDEHYQGYYIFIKGSEVGCYSMEQDLTDTETVKNLALGTYSVTIDKEDKESDFEEFTDLNVFIDTNDILSEEKQDNKIIYILKDISTKELESTLTFEDSVITFEDKDGHVKTIECSHLDILDGTYFTNVLKVFEECDGQKSSVVKSKINDFYNTFEQYTHHDYY